MGVKAQICDMCNEALFTDNSRMACKLNKNALCQQQIDKFDNAFKDKTSGSQSVKIINCRDNHEFHPHCFHKIVQEAFKKYEIQIKLIGHIQSEFKTQSPSCIRNIQVKSTTHRNYCKPELRGRCPAQDCIYVFKTERDLVFRKPKNSAKIFDLSDCNTKSVQKRNKIREVGEKISELYDVFITAKKLCDEKLALIEQADEQFRVVTCRGETQMSLLGEAFAAKFPKRKKVFCKKTTCSDRTGNVSPAKFQVLTTTTKTTGQEDGSPINIKEDKTVNIIQIGKKQTVTETSTTTKYRTQAINADSIALCKAVMPGFPNLAKADANLFINPSIDASEKQKRETSRVAAIKQKVNEERRQAIIQSNSVEPSKKRTLTIHHGDVPACKTRVASKPTSMDAYAAQKNTAAALLRARKLTEKASSFTRRPRAISKDTVQLSIAEMFSKRETCANNEKHCIPVRSLENKYCPRNLLQVLQTDSLQALSNLKAVSEPTELTNFQPASSSLTDVDGTEPEADTCQTTNLHDIVDSNPSVSSEGDSDNSTTSGLSK